MAWTAPMTFVANSVLTAAQLNTHLRDNLMETAPAKATQSGSLFVGAGPNSIVERTVATARVNTTENGTSTTFGDLPTVGPAVTVTTGTKALILTACYTRNNTANIGTAMSWEVSGATTIAASDSASVGSDGQPANQPIRMGTHYWLTTLTPGANTFTCKYRVASNTGTWADRIITVIPF